MNRARNLKVKLNLQMFATQTTLLSGLSVEMKTFYEDNLIDHAEPKLVHDQFGDKYPIPKNGGKTIEFRKYSPLGKASTPLVEGVTPAGNALTVTAITATVDQYGDFIQLSDMLEMTAIDNNVVQATKVLGGQSGRTLDTVTRDTLAGGTNVLFAPKADGTAILTRLTLLEECKLTPDLIFKAATKLDAMNANTIDGTYVAIIHPHVAYDLMRDKEWIELAKYKDVDKYYHGEIGMIGNVRFVKSSEAKIWKDATTPATLAVYGTLVIAANAYGVTEIAGGGLEHIVKQKGSAGSADPLDQRSTVGWKATKVAKRLVEEYMVRIETCSSYSTTATAN